MEKTFIRIKKNRIPKKHNFNWLISNALFCFTFLLSLFSCSNIDKKQDYATVSFSLSHINAKTISPVPENSYESVNSWTITFSDNTTELDDLIFENISFSQNSVQTFKIPLGSYTAKIEGQSTEVSGLIFTDSKTFSLSSSEQQLNLVFSISPKKIESGNFTANFNFSSNASDFLSIATLSSLNRNEIYTLNSSVIKDANSNLYLCEVSSINMQNNQVLPSGFYTFSLKFSYTDEDGAIIENQEVYALNNDFLIEICDDLTTSIAKQIELPAIIQNFYVTNEATKGNGTFASLPINYKEILSKDLKNIKMAKFIFVDNELSEIPQIDLSQLNENRIYQFVLPDDSGYKIANQTENLVLAIQNAAKINLTDSSGSVSKPLIIESISETQTFQDILISTGLEISLAESLSTVYKITNNEDGTKTISKINASESGNESGGTGDSTENFTASIPVMMYTDSAENYNVYYADFETLTDTEAGTNVFSSQDASTFEDVSVDSSNSIYISYKSNDNHFIKKVTCTVQDGKYQYDNGKNYQINASVSHSVNSIILIKQVTDTLYMFDVDENVLNHLLKGTYTTDYTNLTATEISYDSFGTIMDFCVSDDENKVYTYESTTDDYSYYSYYLKSYTITTDSNNSATLTLDKTVLLNSTSTNDGLFYTTYNCSSIEVNDIFFKNNFVYLLVNDHCGTHSRGGILKIATTDITTNSHQSFHCFTTDESVTAENDSQYFYYPQKIVGIGENFILIQDKNNSTNRIVKYSLTEDSISEAKNIKY